MWAEGWLLQLLHQDRDQKSPRGKSESWRRAEGALGMMRHPRAGVSWGTAGGRVSRLCWLAGSESKSDDVVGSGLPLQMFPVRGLLWAPSTANLS